MPPAKKKTVAKKKTTTKAAATRRKPATKKPAPRRTKKAVPARRRSATTKAKTRKPAPARRRVTKKKTPLKTLDHRQARRERRRQFLHSHPRTFGQKIIYAIRLFFYLLPALIILGAITGFSILGYFYITLPSIDNIEQKMLSESTKIYDRDNNLLYEIHGEEKRTVISFAEMPSEVKSATLAAEDDDFYRHSGFNIISIARAVLNNINPWGGGLQGGSTITQQLAKNYFLTPHRTFTRKVREFMLAVKIEARLSKDDILEKYLNTIPYGSNAYGIEAAAATFFEKNAYDLTLAESAFLAGLPKAPSFFSPYGSNLDRALIRAQYILSRMRELAMIDEESYWSAMVETEELEFSTNTIKIKAPHFTLHIKELISEMFGEELLERGGLSIYTTLDPRLQALAEEAVTEYATRNRDQYQASNAALAALDPTTGEVLAMVGSVNYFDNDNDGAVNVTLRPRQPGSSFKPFAYTMGFLKGYSPATVLMDTETDFSRGGKSYKPQNYDGTYRGPVTLRQGLAGSLNIPAVKILYLAGISDTIDLAHDLGITTLQDSPDRYGLSLVLGGGEVKLLDMVSAYGVLANSGLRQQPKYVERIVDHDGRVLYEMKLETGRQVLSPQTAYQTTSILSDNEARTFAFGATSPLQLSGRPVAAKTGTTNEYRDAWTIGYTPSLAAGVWVGNNDNTPMRQGSAGATVAAPIWNKFMRDALSGENWESFERPSGIIERDVSRLSGRLPSIYTPADQIYPEIFTKHNLPTVEENIWQAIKIDRQTGGPVTKLTSPSDIVTFVYPEWHSALPQFDNWEKPVGEHFADPENQLEFTDTDSIIYGKTIEDLPHDPLPSTAPPEVDRTNVLLEGYYTGIGIEYDVWKVQLNDQIALSEAQFYLDKQELAILTTAPWNVKVDVNKNDFELDSTHQLSLVATTTSGQTIREEFTFVVREDATPPKVEITSPLDGSLLQLDDTLMIKTEASDEEGVKEVIYLMDNISLGRVTEAPYELSYQVTDSLADGTHIITARAIDQAGNSREDSVTISVNVDTNDVISLTLPEDQADFSVGNEIRADINITEPGTIMLYVRQVGEEKTRLIGELVADEAETYELFWRPAATGDFLLYARLLDSTGTTLDSNGLWVKVEG